MIFFQSDRDVQTTTKDLREKVVRKAREYDADAVINFRTEVAAGVIIVHGTAVKITRRNSKANVVVTPKTIT